MDDDATMMGNGKDEDIYIYIYIYIYDDENSLQTTLPKKPAFPPSGEPTSARHPSTDQHCNAQRSKASNQSRWCMENIDVMTMMCWYRTQQDGFVLLL